MGASGLRGGRARLPNRVESEKPVFLEQPRIRLETRVLKTERRRTQDAGVGVQKVWQCWGLQRLCPGGAGKRGLLLRREL